MARENQSVERQLASEETVQAVTERVKSLREQLQGQVQQQQAIAEQLVAAAEELGRLGKALAGERQRAEVLASIVMDLHAGRSLPEVMATALRRVTVELGGDNGFLLLFEPDGRHLRCAEELWAGGVPLELLDMEGLPHVKRAVENKEAVYVARQESKAGETFWFDNLGVEGILVAPLFVGSSRIGVILINFARGRHLTPEDVAFVQVIAGPCALAIDRARAQDIVATERARFETVLRQMPAGVAIAEAPSGKIILANEQALHIWRFYDRRPESTKDYGWFKGFHPDLRPYRPEEWPLARSVHTGEVVTDEEIQFVRGDGTCGTVRVSSAPIRDTTGRVAAAVVVIQDITERREAELERERLLAELDATIAAIADALIIYDDKGDVVRMNASAKSLLGYTTEQFSKRLPERLADLRIETPEGKPFRIEELPVMRALRGETVLGCVGVMHPPNGKTVWGSVSAAPIYTKDGRLLGAAVTVTDITAQQELLKQREEFVNVVSHDLRAPLTIIQGQAQVLERAAQKGGLDGLPVRSIQAIITGTRRMNAMIQDLVDAARIESGQLKVNVAPVDIRAFVLDLRERLATLDGGDRIQLTLPERPPFVLADPDRLERILTNLVTNALKYSAPGTPVSIALAQRDDEVVASVADQGQGVPPEMLPHLFERYYRTDLAQRRREEGLGLGLYITKGLVEAQGGRIWVESVVDRGSTFSFSLPACKSDATKGNGSAVGECEVAG